MKKKNKKESKSKWVIPLILFLLLLLVIVFFLIFGTKKSFTIVFDTNGGNEISSMVVKNGEIVELPKVPSKEGYVFTGWLDDDGNIVTSGSKIDDDITLKANWIKKDAKTVTLHIDGDNGTEVNKVVIEKGQDILLPITPIKDGYIFVGWLNNSGLVVNKNMKVNSDLTLRALWIKKGTKTNTIKFNTDGGNKIGNIIVENGKVISLPINPTKTGYAFAGWVDENGNSVTKDTIINKNMTIKALWKEPYTCPSGCTPIGDGKTCSKVVTKDMVTKTTCPSGYKLVKGQCLDVKNQYHALSIDYSPFWKCNSSSEVMYTELDGTGGAFMWCAKKTNKITTKGCPSGYTKDGTICKKTETVKCTAN